MATQPETTAPAEKAAKAKDVLNDMDARRILPDIASTVSYLAMCAATYSDFNDYPVAAPGVGADEEGNVIFDESIYSDTMNVMVSVLSQRGDGAGNSTVKAIVIAPIPSFDSVLDNAEARQWLQRIMEKELNHVAVRQLRKADDIGDVVSTMPTTLAEYITSNRESGGLLAAYETLWRPIKDSLAKLSRPWKLVGLSKRELRRGLESASYADDTYPTLENTKSGSLFVLALQAFILQAKKQGLDPTIFERWTEGRDEKVIDVRDEDESDELSLDDLAAAFEANEPTPAPANEPTDSTPATDAETPEATDAPDAAPDAEPEATPPAA